MDLPGPGWATLRAMPVDRNELETIDRERLVEYARAVGVERAEVLTRLELIDEILSLAIEDEQERRIARGLLGRARDLVARVVEKGLNLPDAAHRLRTMAPPAAAWRRGPPPIATVSLAEVYARQGHPALALRVLDEVLAGEPDHDYARSLRERIAADGQASRSEEPPVAEAVEPQNSPAPLPEPVPVPAPPSPPAHPRRELEPAHPPESILRLDIARPWARLTWQVRATAFARARCARPDGHLALRLMSAEAAWEGPRLHTDDLRVDALKGSVERRLPEDTAGVCAAIGWLSAHGFTPIASAEWVADAV